MKWRRRSEVCHPGPHLPAAAQSGPALQITHKPTSQTVMTQKPTTWVRMANWSSQNDVPIFLLPGRKQSWWFFSLNSHLRPHKEVQIAPPELPPIGVYLDGTQTLFARQLFFNKSCPLSNLSPGKQLSSRDSPQPQLCSRMCWTTQVPGGLNISSICSARDTWKKLE